MTESLLELMTELADDEVKHARIQELIQKDMERTAIDVLIYRMGDRIAYDTEEDGKYAVLSGMPGPVLRREMATAAAKRILNP